MWVFYEAGLFLYLLICLPRLLWDNWKYRKYAGSIRQRLGREAVPSFCKPIWIHGVSVGEINAASALLPFIQATHPDRALVVTTTTKTGFEAAKRVFKDSHIFFLPLDFSWAIGIFVKRLKPALVILSEGELWPNLLRFVKRYGGKNVVINGKISKRSFRRYSFFPKVARRLFSLVDLWCVQRDSLPYFQHFVAKTSLIPIDNIKSAIPPPVITERQKALLYSCINTNNPVIVIASTHPDEEQLLLDLLSPLPLTIFLAPRHPQRVKAVAALLEKRGQFFLFSKMEKGDRASTVLVDVMGKLFLCYASASLAIVGGSFVPIGGHNILEPVQVGTPVLFGPYMEKQQEMQQKILKLGAGFQATKATVLDLCTSLLFTDSTKLIKARSNTHQFLKSAHKSAEATWNCIQGLL